MYNIYHLLNSKAGWTLRTRLTLAFKWYKAGDKLFWTWEHEALSCLITLLDCEFLTSDEYNELYEQLCYIMRLYKGARGSALGRKDVQ